MENFVNDVEKRLAKCTEWPQVSDAFESEISPEHIPHFLEILKEFSIIDPKIKDVIETNLDEFLKQMKIVCFHMISTFYSDVIRDTKKTEFFTIHVK